MLGALRKRIAARAMRPVDAASLVALRVAFGLLLAFAALRFWQRGWIHEHFVAPQRFFTYWGFDWVKPLPGHGMVVVFALMTAAALALAAGAATRWAALLFTVLFTYAHLCDVTHYLNHYVLVTLLGGMLVALPVGRWWSVDALRARRRGPCASRLVPAWWVWLVRFQVGVVYFFGGVGKLGGDWLWRAEPLATWLSRAGDVPLLGAAAHTTWLAFAMSWAGAAFDLAVPFLLCVRRTRPFAFAAACGFHLLTARLFQLGMFPWLMMAFATVFFVPHWPVAVAERLGLARAGASALGVAAAGRAPPMHGSPWALRAALLVVVLQIVVPLRGLLYPGDGLWTEQGFRFAWKVMLVEKNGDVSARVTDRATGRTSVVSPAELYDPVQVKMMATQPDLLLQLAHAIRDRERARGREVEVRLDVFVAMNGRRSRRLIDPAVDLAREEDGWAAKPWIMPLAPEPVPPLLPLSQRSGH